MGYYKIVDDGYIGAIGTGARDNITAEEYSEILTTIRNKPPRTDTTDYRLKEDFTWEAYEIEPMPDPEPTDEDYATVGRILMGVES